MRSSVGDGRLFTNATVPNYWRSIPNRLAPDAVLYGSPVGSRCTRKLFRSRSPSGNLPYLIAITWLSPTVDAVSAVTFEDLVKGRPNQNVQTSRAGLKPLLAAALKSVQGWW